MDEDGIQEMSNEIDTAKNFVKLAHIKRDDDDSHRQYNITFKIVNDVDIFQVFEWLSFYIQELVAPDKINIRNLYYEGYTMNTKDDGTAHVKLMMGS